MKKIFLGLIFLLSLFFVKNVSANGKNQFVTIVNPVRMSSYNNNPQTSLVSEYQVVRNLNLPATWLVTYDVLEREDLLTILKGMDQKQEFGIFLEVTKNFADEAEVDYNDSGFWHHANSVFLSGYSQEERIKLIDKVFGTFKDKFGYYPTSVGSWWTDSFSLNYMKEKYGITANLGCSDQFSTDGYKIWGQPFSTPFYPSEYHAGIPASDTDSRLNLVTILWAPRDPLNGYYNSLFSTQDYLSAGKNLDIDYFKSLVKLYAFKNQNQFGHITVGLEADLDPQAYKGEFFKQLSFIKDLYQKGEISVLNMNEFSDWFRSAYENSSSSNFIQTNDLFNTGQSVTWFQNSKYRFSYEEKEDGEIEIRDFRVYSRSFIEPYYISPNANFNLTINTPFVVDKVGDPNNVWILEKESSITFLDEEILIKTKSKIPDFVKKSRYLNISKTKNIIKITFKDFNSLKEGTVIKDFSVEAKHAFNSPKTLLALILRGDYSFFKKIEYIIPQEEIIALNYLYAQPKGIVLVYDKECLQCSYSTNLKPLIFSNSRKYIQKMSSKKIVYNSDIFESLSREETKEKIKKLNIKYIYLVKFEGYSEKIPYSPGDLGIEKIFENANAEIWIVK